MREIILSFFGSLLPAVLYNVNKKQFLWVGLAGVSGWVVYSMLNASINKVIIATFAGAVAVGIYSETMARVLKYPATVFSVAGMFPLVPGIGAYNTVQAIVENKISDAAAIAVETVASAGSIAVGIMFASALFRIFWRKKRET